MSLMFLSSMEIYGGTTPFVTTWLVDNEEDLYGIIGRNEVSIPITQGNYNYTVDWGDGKTSNHTGAATHIYTAPGIYTVSITGIFPGINFKQKSRLLSIDQWGDNAWVYLQSAFQGCYNLQGNFTDTPNLSNVKSMSNMFNGAGNFNYYIGNWDVSNVTNMRYLFHGARKFNQNLNAWDVSNVTNMEYMFSEALEFNQNLDQWNVSNVTYMKGMFSNARVFNQNIGNWNVSNVIDMESMFSSAKAFNQNIGNWNVSQVTNMKSMFYGTDKFNQNLNNWDVSKVTATDKMFLLAIVFNGDISSWDVSAVLTMTDMFSHALVFNQNISNWNVSQVLNMKGMFYIAREFNQNIENWDVSRVRDMRLMFSGAWSFNQDLSRWNVSSVTDMGSMFADVTLSMSNYDALLIGWSKLNLQHHVNFHGGYSQYCIGETARNNITSTYSWKIIDGGTPRPKFDHIDNQEGLDNYTLPVITGKNLSGNEAYYTKPNAEGTAYIGGDIINFHDFTSYPITLYIYDEFSSICSSEQSFKLTINTSSLTCTSIEMPISGATNVPTNTSLIWKSVAGAEGYKLSIGTNSGKTNILETTDVGNVLSFNPPRHLPADIIIFVNITPYNTYTEGIDCQGESFTTKPTSNLDIPKYFTPNNDGYHDVWKVPDPLNTIASIYIYNRYGKLLKHITNISKGWNGIYLNKPLPTNDYWYTIQYKDGRTLNGHFSLIK